MKNLLIVVLFIISASAFAEKPYGTAGCGWGSQIHGKEGNQILAATTNGTSGNQTFAISSGTSNCVAASDQTAKIKNFIEANYESLITDMAKGQGDSVKTLSGFYGCDADLFATNMKAHYSDIAPKKNDATKVMINVNNVIEDTAALNTNCTHAI